MRITFNVDILIFDGVEELDFIGSLEVLGKVNDIRAKKS